VLWLFLKQVLDLVETGRAARDNDIGVAADATGEQSNIIRYPPNARPCDDS
jgi:hypothetical protein